MNMGLIIVIILWTAVLLSLSLIIHNTWQVKSRRDEGALRRQLRISELNVQELERQLKALREYKEGLRNAKFKFEHWHLIPKEFFYISMSSAGKWNAYSKKPSIWDVSEITRVPTRIRFPDRFGMTISLDYLDQSLFPEIPKDEWLDSLIRRPLQGEKNDNN